MFDISNAPSFLCGSAKKIVIVTFIVVFCLATVFAIFTRHAWEDYYITYRASQNLARGHGLVYTPGERIHTFTSPLGVLLPALFSRILGNTSDVMVLWFFRMLSAAALASAAVLLLQIACRLSMQWIPAIFLIGMFALDAKTLDFTINGMETGLMMLFLALTLRALIAPGRLPAFQLGLAWAGLMWTRPDSVVFIAGLSLGVFLFNSAPSLAPDRPALLKLLLKAGLVTTLLYLPWIGWAWHYYGSPIPNTVIAKGLNRQKAPLDLVGALLVYPVLSLPYKVSMASAFLAPYASAGGWPAWLVFWSKGLAWPSAMAWFVPKIPPMVRAISLALMLGYFYLDEISPFPFPWYLPPCTLLSILVLAGILDQWSKWVQGRARSATRDERAGASFRRLTFTIPAAALFLSLLLTIAAACQLRVQQEVIEEGNRKQIGLWLGEHAASRAETVFLEPLGYIGFYSQLKMLDFPGLSSREVIAARRKLGSDRAADLIGELKPDWLVLRPTEIKTIGEMAPELLLRTYEPVKTFDVSDRVRSYRWLPGRQYLMMDQTYIVYRRRL